MTGEILQDKIDGIQSEMGAENAYTLAIKSIQFPEDLSKEELIKKVLLERRIRPIKKLHEMAIPVITMDETNHFFDGVDSRKALLDSATLTAFIIAESWVDNNTDEERRRNRNTWLDDSSGQLFREKYESINQLRKNFIFKVTFAIQSLAYKANKNGEKELAVSMENKAKQILEIVNGSDEGRGQNYEDMNLKDRLAIVRMTIGAAKDTLFELIIPQTRDVKVMTT